MHATLAIELAPSIASLFNSPLTTGKIPDDWKMANVFLIPKNSHSGCMVLPIQFLFYPLLQDC